MKINSGIYYRGIRFYDKDQNVIHDLTWLDDGNGDWTPLEDGEIPEGKAIIGLECNQESY